MKIGFLRYGKLPEINARCLFALASLHNDKNIEFFYFTPERINIEKKLIKGLFFENGKFVEKETSYPDIIDDHYSFKNKFPELYKSFLETSLFCYMRLGSKTKIYNILKNSDCYQYLIETYNYKDCDINNLLLKHTALILKPNKGNQGKNIYKLYKENNFYYLHYKDNTEKLTNCEFENKYSSVFKKGYIVQPYLNSVTKQGNPFDIRINIRRGKNGKWTLAKIYPRIGNINAITSNIAQGGYIADIKDFLYSEFGEKQKDIYNKLVNISNIIPKKIQNNYKNLIDALGIDVGIDRDNYELKFFEINSFPGNHYFPFETAEIKIQYYIYLFENFEKLHKIQRETIVISDKILKNSEI